MCIRDSPPLASGTSTVVAVPLAAIPGAEYSHFQRTSASIEVAQTQHSATRTGKSLARDRENVRKSIAERLPRAKCQGDSLRKGVQGKAMQKRRLGQSGLEVSAIGFGCMG